MKKKILIGFIMAAFCVGILCVSAYCVSLINHTFDGTIIIPPLS